MGVGRRGEGRGGERRDGEGRGGVERGGGVGNGGEQRDEEGSRGSRGVFRGNIRVPSPTISQKMMLQSTDLQGWKHTRTCI